MEYVSLRLDSALLKQVEKAIKQFRYSTKTEFFREAVRDKLSELSKKQREEKAWLALFAARGALKDHAISDKEFYRKRGEFSKELEKEWKEKYGFK